MKTIYHMIPFLAIQRPARNFIIKISNYNIRAVISNIQYFYNINYLLRGDCCGVDKKNIQALRSLQETQYKSPMNAQISVCIS